MIKRERDSGTGNGSGNGIREREREQDFGEREMGEIEFWNFGTLEIWKLFGISRRGTRTCDF